MILKAFVLIIDLLALAGISFWVYHRAGGQKKYYWPALSVKLIAGQ
jgi:hypothetical protein